MHYLLTEEITGAEDSSYRLSIVQADQQYHCDGGMLSLLEQYKDEGDAIEALIHLEAYLNSNRDESPKCTISDKHTVYWALRAASGNGEFVAQVTHSLAYQSVKDDQIMVLLIVNP